MKHEPIKPARVMTATEFKAKCLEVMDRVSSGEWSQVVITKRGKDVAVLRAPDGDPVAVRDRYAFFGSMKGTVTLPPGVDIVGPIYDPERDGEFEAERGSWEPKVK